MKTVSFLSYNDGDRFHLNTMLNDSLMRSAIEIDEIDILSRLAPLMGMPVKPNCPFNDACTFLGPLIFRSIMRLVIHQD